MIIGAAKSLEIGGLSCGLGVLFLRGSVLVFLVDMKSGTESGDGEFTGKVDGLV